MARVYRQGQTKPVQIYRLFTSGTVEEGTVKGSNVVLLNINVISLCLSNAKSFTNGKFKRVILQL